MSRPIIEVQGISKRYRLGDLNAGSFREELHQVWGRLSGKAPRKASSDRDFWALRDVSFEVQPGEVVGVIGRNGAGKSTLLKVLSRITEPTSGRAVLRGRVSSLLEVGTGFHPDLSGRENVYLNGAILGMRRAEIDRKFDEIVAFAEVEKFIDTPVKRYSSGMYVRLAFAVAAHLDPEILIVDEVLAVGDIDFQKKCIGAMGSVAKSGRTVILVSHNVGLIETLCTKAVLLNGGTVASQGAPPIVVADYLAGNEPADPDNLLDQPRHHAGSRKALFSGIRILNPSGQANVDLKAGDGMTVQLSIRASERISQPWIGMKLRTALNQTLFHFANREAGFDLPPIHGDGVVECKIDTLNLLPGRYFLDLSLFDVKGGLQDEVNPGASFDVVASDVLGSGMPMEQQYGVVFFKSAWSLRNGSKP